MREFPTELILASCIFWIFSAPERLLRRPHSWFAIWNCCRNNSGDATERSPIESNFPRGTDVIAGGVHAYRRRIQNPR